MKLDNVIAKRPTKTIYRDGDTVIKLFNEDYLKSDILNEALNQARVEETGLLIPKILEVTKIDGKWAIISEYIEGTTLENFPDILFTALLPSVQPSASCPVSPVFHSHSPEKLSVPSRQLKNVLFPHPFFPITATT